MTDSPKMNAIGADIRIVSSSPTSSFLHPLFKRFRQVGSEYSTVSPNHVITLIHNSLFDSLDGKLVLGTFTLQVIR